MKAKCVEDLQVWQRANEFWDAINAILDKPGLLRDRSLRDQISAAADSVVSNIREGFEQPVYYWDPVIAPSGAQFYTGEAFPDWQGNLFVGSLKEKRLVRLTLEGQFVTGEEHLLVDRNQRIRDVREGPDGALYIVTDEDAGELWKITPRR